MSRRFNFRRLTALLLAMICLFGMVVRAQETSAESASVDSDAAAQEVAQETPEAPAEAAVEEAAAEGAAEVAEEAQEVVPRNPEIPEEYNLVAQSSRFNLYLCEDNLSIAVESKANQSILWSTLRDQSQVMNDNNKSEVQSSVNFYNSGVTLEYITDLVATPAQINPAGSADCHIEYDYVENGFTAHISYPSIGISHDLELTMDDMGLHVRVPMDSFVEEYDQPFLIIRTADGEQRVDLMRYETIGNEKEFVLITEDGTEYIVDSSASPTASGTTQVSVTVSDKSNQKLPLAVKYIDVVNEAGETVMVPNYRAVVRTVKGTNGAADSYVLVTDGAEYPLPAASIGSKKTDGTIIIKTGSSGNLTLPLDKALAPVPTVAVKDAAGNACTLLMDQVTAFRTNEYKTGKLADGSTFRYLTGDIVDTHANSFTAAGIYLFPFLGYTYMGETEGYMIIPDGQGALIELKNNITDGKKNDGLYSGYFSRPVYGTNIGKDGEFRDASVVDVEQIIMPVFGMVHTDEQIGFLGVVEEGDVGCKILAYMNGTNKSRFDYIFANYNFRYVYAQPMGPVSSPDFTAGAVMTRSEHRRSMDIVQHFLLTDGEDATYAGLAVAYRDYMIDKGVFDNASDRPFDVQLDFVGLEREKYIFGKQDVVMTTFEQAKEIVEDLYRGGVNEMSIVLRGWQEGGLTGGVPVEGFDPARSLGGKRALEELREYCESFSIDFALEVDVLSLNVETHPTLTYSSFEQVTSRTYERSTFGQVYTTLRYLTPSISAQKAATVVQEMLRNDVTGISFTGITQLVSDFSYKDEYYDSAQLAEIYSGIVRDAGENMTVTLSSPNAYLWPEAHVLSDMPVSGSDHNYTAAEIPFLSIALSGQIPYYAEYVNFQANTHSFFLHLVEQGSRPAFLLTWEDPIELQNTNSSDIYSSRYELYENMIVSWYTELNELHEAVGEDGVIVNHERFGDLVRVTWDNNGTQIPVYINFGTREATLDGVTVDALDWEIGQEVSTDGN